MYGECNNYRLCLAQTLLLILFIKCKLEIRFFNISVITFSIFFFLAIFVELYNLSFSEISGFIFITKEHILYKVLLFHLPLVVNRAFKTKTITESM